MGIIRVDPLHDLLWQQLIDDGASSVFHTPEWMRVLRDTYGFDMDAYVVVNARGEPLGGLPFCYIDDIRGRRIITLPFSDYCDPLVGERRQWEALINKLSADDWPILLRCLHNNLPLADERFACVKRAKWHGMNLRDDVEKLWLDLHSSARRAVRKAERAGVKVQRARHRQDLRAFYDMHVNVRKYKYNLLAQPYRMFEHIWEHFIEPEKGFLLTAVYQGEIIAGILFLQWQDTLYYKFNASAAHDLSLRPNDMMIWEAVKYGHQNGYSRLDFGLSDWEQEGLLRYKRKFATEEKTISFLEYKPPEFLATQQADDVRSLLPQLTDLFTEESVPNRTTEKAGDLLYRYFA